MRDIENLIGKKIPAIDEHEFPLQDKDPAFRLNSSNAGCRKIVAKAMETANGR